MLDDLSELDSQQQPKLTARTRNVAESTSHLSYEDLEAYVQGRLAPARLQHCRGHLDSCDACRAELEDLRALRSDLPGTAQALPIRRESSRSRRRNGLKLHAVGALAMVLVAAAAAVFWWRHEKSPIAAATPAPAATLARSVTPAPVATASRTAPPSPVTLARPRTPTALSVTPIRDARLAEDVAALPDDLRPAVTEAIQQGRLRLPADLTLLRGRALAAAAATQTNTGFALLSPFGEAVSESRPEFRWQPLPGAVKYSIAIVDEKLHPVQRSAALRATEWRPRRALHRGQTYLWQVTATTRDGSTVVASSPPPLGAFVQIISTQLADEIGQFRHRHETSHLVIGVLYAQAGMLTAGAGELRKVAPGDPSYGTAKSLLDELPAEGP